MNATATWILLCLALLYSVFCRSVHVRKSTHTAVRLALWVTGLCALVGLGAPVYGWEPDLVSLCLLATVIAVHTVKMCTWCPTLHFHKHMRHDGGRRKEDRI